MRVCVGAMVIALVLSGCGDEGENAAWRGDPEVAGAVSLDGVPLAGATVSFHRATGEPLVAVTDDVGLYALDLTGIEDSVIGKYAVRIDRSSTPASDDEADELPKRYNDETELVIDILDGANNLNFDLFTVDDEGEPAE